MREITTHHTNDANRAIKIEVIEDEDGEPHKYHLSANGDEQACLSFQWGPIKLHGVNGITNEVLLAIVRDRLEFFQRGQFACAENAIALFHVVQAAAYLENRTNRRTAQGVEGTHELDVIDDEQLRATQLAMSKQRVELPSGLHPVTHSDRSWIADIPFEAWAKFQREHTSAYAFDELLELLPAEHVARTWGERETVRESASVNPNVVQFEIDAESFSPCVFGPWADQGGGIWARTMPARTTPR